MNVSSINGQVGKAFNYLAKQKSMIKQLDKGITNPGKFASTMLVTSIVSKDFIGCIFYTLQSFFNEKLPELKRKFVAALDLMNGILMIGGQLIIGKVIEAKFTPWAKSKFTGVITDEKGKEIVKNENALLYKDNVKKLINKVAGSHNITLDEKLIDKIVKRIADTHTKLLEIGLGIFITALATTAFIKRTIVPLISTPLAAWFRDKFMNKKPEAKPEAAPVSQPELQPKPELKPEQPKPQSKPQPKPESKPESESEEEELNEAA